MKEITVYVTASLKVQVPDDATDDSVMDDLNEMNYNFKSTTKDTLKIVDSELTDFEITELFL